MAAISTAIGSARKARVSGYKINKGVFNLNVPNLPQQIVILAEANTANQGALSTNATEITSASQAGAVYGYGSPVHQIARILFPRNGNGVGVPVVVMAQLTEEGAAATVITWSVSGVATSAAVHEMIIAGRDNIDGSGYQVNIAVGDSPAAIAAKYLSAINAVLSCPVIATMTNGTAESASVAFSATSLTAGQTVTLGGLTYTSTATTTQTQLAAAFASLADGATTGGGTGTGTYSGKLTGWSSGVASGSTVVFTSSIADNVANLVQIGTGASAVITTTPGVPPTVILTSKWEGLTAADLTAVINTNFNNTNNTAGITYALLSTVAGSGTVDISGALAQFQNVWYTTVINSYGTSMLATLEAFNGVPDPNTPTGQYDPTIFMPFMAFFGSTLTAAADLITITNASARINQVTNVLCPAPGSAGMPYEAAANMVALFCPTMQNTPYLDVYPQKYPDMPVPSTGLIGDMATYNNRDNLVKNGCSTVTLVNGQYQVQDLVTTYHPAGEDPLQFNYCRNLNLDWNIYDGYNILQITFVNGKVIIANNQVTNVSNAIKPSEWAAILFDFFDNEAESGLINDPAFSKASLQVQIDPTNPNRFNTVFNYKRTGTAIIESTDVNAGF